MWRDDVCCSQICILGEICSVAIGSLNPQDPRLIIVEMIFRCLTLFVG